MDGHLLARTAVGQHRLQRPVPRERANLTEAQARLLSANDSLGDGRVAKRVIPHAHAGPLPDLRNEPQNRPRVQRRAVPSLASRPTHEERPLPGGAAVREVPAQSSDDCRRSGTNSRSRRPLPRIHVVQRARSVSSRELTYRVTTTALRQNAAFDTTESRTDT